LPNVAGGTLLTPSLRNAGVFLISLSNISQQVFERTRKTITLDSTENAMTLYEH